MQWRFQFRRIGFSVVSTVFAASMAVASGTRPAEGGSGMVNVVNFIRGVEPRVQVDLYEPVVQQIRLAREYGLPVTFLIQYDALVQDRFVELLRRELRETDEIGAWLEVVQPQVEAAGLTWRGRFPWDWHTDVGFTVGYTPAQREKLIDVYMERFRAAFGRWPRSVGCWLIDAHTLNYLADKYGIVAACICKDQVGTDGYTLWGGYWNQAYYPSRRNAFMPAQSAERQLNVPVFRMLGSDPIYQYDHGLGEAAQGVVSLEPVYPQAGGNPDWVRWFFNVNFATPSLGFGYAQVGQENSFGWPDMSKGLTDQMRLLAEWSRAGRIRVETLSASGEWFRRTFPHTPATSVSALTDWKNEGRQSIWYNSRFYRMNLLVEQGGCRIRDLHLFDEDYVERYLEKNVTTHACTYDTLPVVDGFNWSSPDHRAGLRPVLLGADGTRRPLTGDQPSTCRVTVSDPDALLIAVSAPGGGELGIRCEPARLTCRLQGVTARTEWGLELSWSPGKSVPIQRVAADSVEYLHNGFAYRLRCAAGTIESAAGRNGILIRADDTGTIRFEMAAR